MSELETGQEELLPREELLKTIWDEKREKLAERTDVTTTLCIPIPEPQIDIQDTITEILDTLSEDPERSFNWSQNWGKTKVVLGKEKHTPIDFMQKGTIPYSNLIPISTTHNLSTPKFESEAQEKFKYNILLNHKPVTIEGAMLQIERMVDELVWVTSIQIRDKLNIPHDEAYKMALNDIVESGVGYAYCNEDEILTLREKNDQYAVRMYGNVNKKGKVPKVIGSVVPTDANIAIEKYHQPSILDFCNTEKTIDQELDFSKLSNEPYITFAMTIGKQPHMGHVLLMGVAETAREALGKNTPILMDANDTGPRIVRTIATGSKLMGIEPNEVVTLLNERKISVQAFESWYQKRAIINKRELALVMSQIDLENVHLYKQAEAIENLLHEIFDSKVPTILESTILDRSKEVTKLCTKGWENTGFAFYNDGKNVKILESDGISTARTMRTAALITSSLSTKRGTPIYIDADSCVQDGLDLYEKITGHEGIQFMGAGLSKNLEIASGTKGNAISYDETYEILKEDLSPREILDSVKYLVNTRQQVLGIDNRLPFFDYASDEALIEDIRRAHLERKELMESFGEIQKEIESLVDNSVANPSFRRGNKTALQVRYVNNLKDIVSGQKMNALFITPRVIQENKKVKSRIDHYRKTMDKQEAQLLTYQEIISTPEEELSVVLNHLKMHGYKGEQLQSAIKRYIGLNASLVLRKGILYHTIDQIKDILSDTKTLDRNTSQILINSLNICEQRMKE